MDKESEVLAYLRQKFPKTSEVKMKAGIFIGPQMDLIRPPIFQYTILQKEEPGRQLKKSAETF